MNLVTRGLHVHGAGICQSWRSRPLWKGHVLVHSLKPLPGLPYTFIINHLVPGSV